MVQYQGLWSVSFGTPGPANKCSGTANLGIYIYIEREREKEGLQKYGTKYRANLLYHVFGNIDATHSTKYDTVNNTC